MWLLFCCFGPLGFPWSKVIVLSDLRFSSRKHQLRRRGKSSKQTTQKRTVVRRHCPPMGSFWTPFWLPRYLGKTNTKISPVSSPDRLKGFPKLQGAEPGQPGCPGDMCWDAPTKDAGDATFCSVYLWAGSQTKPLFFSSSPHPKWIQATK